MSKLSSLIGTLIVTLVVVISLLVWVWVLYDGAQLELESSRWESQMLRAQEREIREIGKSPSRSATP